jgi:AraC-like DNA-binding protein
MIQPPRVRSTETDTRGIVDPAEMLRHVAFERAASGPVLDGIVDWFWAVAWSFPDGVEHHQQVLNLPAGNLSVGTIDDRGVPLEPACGRLYGVLSSISHRRLSGVGWTVAAKTTTGGLGVLFGGSARRIAGRECDLNAIEHLDGAAVVAGVIAASDASARIAVLRRALEDLLAHRDAAMVNEARHVAEVARLAELDRSVRRVDDLAKAAGVSVRTLERLFSEHVGVSPAWVIRRWRIIEAAEAARAGPASDFPGWAALANDLGYADQSHLVRDFRKHLGLTPGEYLARQSGEAR